MRNQIDAHRRLAAGAHLVQRVGEALGLVVIGCQFHQQQPVTAHRRGDTQMLVGQRTDPAVDQFQGGNAVQVAKQPAGVDQRVEVLEAAHGGHPVRRIRVQSQVECGDHAQRSFGTDEQRR